MHTNEMWTAMFNKFANVLVLVLKNRHVHSLLFEILIDIIGSLEDQLPMVKAKVYGSAEPFQSWNIELKLVLQ
jgi:hypothetical protein